MRIIGLPLSINCALLIPAIRFAMDCAQWLESSGPVVISDKRGRGKSAAIIKYYSRVSSTESLLIMRISPSPL